MLLDRSSLAIQEHWPRAVARPVPTPSRREQAVLLADALERLPADYREVFILRNLEHIPFDEIAARMGRSAGAVRMLWTRAIKKRSASCWRRNHHEPVNARSADRGRATSEAADDAEVGRVLDAYLADLEAGRPADPERLLADHPALAGQLRACLEVMNLADRLVDASGRPSPRRLRRPDGYASMPAAPGTSVLSTLGFGLRSASAHPPARPAR